MSTPELCSGVHQKGCDLEGVEGATPPTPNHSFKTMTAFNTDYNNTELLDQELTIEQLEAVAGGVDVIEGEDDSWWYKRMGGGGNSFFTELETGCGPDPDVSEVGY